MIPDPANTLRLACEALDIEVVLGLRNAPEARQIHEQDAAVCGELLRERSHVERTHPDAMHQHKCRHPAARAVEFQDAQLIVIADEPVLSGLAGDLRSVAVWHTPSLIGSAGHSSTSDEPC